MVCLENSWVHSNQPNSQDDYHDSPPPPPLIVDCGNVC